MKLRVFRTACKLAYEIGTSISLGGGEPTLHKHFWKFFGLALGSTFDTWVWLATNGKRTEDALALAIIGRQGVASISLSLDKYHEPIDPRVVSAFDKKDDRDPADNRNIRTVNEVIAVGRASDWGTSDACRCNELFVTPDGSVYVCGCLNKKLGHVFDTDIAQHINEAQEEMEDHDCYTEYLRERESR
jgi:MoaA/NifB/PqqE/SkfB family radical SAM enzyme